MSRTKTKVRLLQVKQKSEEGDETQLGAIQWISEVEKKCAESTLTVDIQDEESLYCAVRFERLRNIYVKPNVEQLLENQEGDYEFLNLNTNYESSSGGTDLRTAVE